MKPLTLTVKLAPLPEPHKAPPVLHVEQGQEWIRAADLRRKLGLKERSFPQWAKENLAGVRVIRPAGKRPQALYNVEDLNAWLAATAQ